MGETLRPSGQRKPPNSLHEGEQTLIRPDRHHHDDLERSGDDSEWGRIKESQKTQERCEINAGEELLLKGTYKSVIKSDSRRKAESSQTKQNRNAFENVVY